MKNRNGFTLIELLAVIAILALLVIIALPYVFRMFTSAKKESFLNEVNQIMRISGQNFINDNGEIYAYSNASGSSNKLGLTGGNNLKYLVKLNSEGKIIRLQVTNGTYCYNKSGNIKTAVLNDVKDTTEGCTLNIDDNYNALTAAVFLPGQEFNIKIKQLAGDDTSEKGHLTVDTNITAILKSNTEPTEANKTSEHIVSTTDSQKAIYAWYDSGTIYYWSEIEHPSLNEDSSFTFALLTNLTNISGLSEINTANVTNMLGMFLSNKASAPMKISDLTPLRNWDTSSVTNMSGMFQFCTSITSLSGLNNWNVSNVTNMLIMFGGQKSVPMKISDLTPLRNWDTSSVTDMSGMFQFNSGLTTLSGLENWDTSNVTNMSNMFLGRNDCIMNLTDISALRNWNTKNVTSLEYMFQYNSSLASFEGLNNWNVSNVKSLKGTFLGTGVSDLTALSNWNTSNVTNMIGMFENCVSLLKLDGLESWNVSQVTNMNYSFDQMLSLTDASAINDWDIRNVLDFTNMFNKTPVHPEFSKVNGSWNNGTFISN